MSTDAEARERAVLGLLDRWPWSQGGTIIGGYAVLAYGPPRYSDDLDIVVSKQAAEGVRSWLATEGLRLRKRAVPNPRHRAGEVGRYVGGPITLDLLSDSVRDREARVDIPESWIAQRAVRARLVTLSGSTTVEVTIARPEALWALKLQAGRARDVSDLFAMADTPVDGTEVTALFRSLRTEPLLAKLHSVLASLRLRKSYVDSLSRRGFGSPTNPANLRRWARFEAQVGAMILPL